MALILFGATPCALCAAILRPGDEVVATAHFIGDRSDSLRWCSDAAMHRAGFFGRPGRAAVVARFNATVGVIRWGHGSSHEMEPDGTIFRHDDDAFTAATELFRARAAAWGLAIEFVPAGMEVWHRGACLRLRSLPDSLRLEITHGPPHSPAASWLELHVEPAEPQSEMPTFAECLDYGLELMRANPRN